MRGIVENIAKQLATDLKETMVKCFDLGVVDERKRIMEKLKKGKQTPEVSTLLSELEASLKELKL